VPLGAAKLTVTPASGGAVTKDVSVAAPVGGGPATVVVALPEVTDVVAAAPAAATAPDTGATGAGASAPPAAPGSAAAPPTATTPESVPAPPAPTAPAPPGPPPLLNTLFNLVILGGLLYGGYLLARRNGWTLERVLAQLGVQPIPETAVGTVSAPGPAPAPPSDPSVCPYCGERKDALTGRCACSVDAVAAANPFVAPASGRGEGPRLIATQGTYMGQIFPLAAEASIGRDAGNAVPLPNDTTVSRRHALIWAENGGYKIQDEGSSNGTYVNGSRVTDAALRPGDEVGIGGTRFRFEV
jgi:hypothetical protein